MKKSSFSLVASFLLLLSGCQSEDLVNDSKHVGARSLVASIEGQDYVDASRTAVDDSGNVTWIATDELGVYGNVSENMKYISTGSGTDITFTGELPETEEAQWAYYPYDEKASLDEEILTITLPDNYTYTGNSNAPMLGKPSGNDKFSFKHLGGLIRFTLGGGIPDNADRFVIASVGENQPLAGQVSFAIEGDNVTMSITSNGKQSITYDVSAIKDAEEFQYFFVPLPVGDYSKLQVSFYKKDVDNPVFTRSLSNLKVGRAEMICMPILDWNTGKQYKLSENTTDITNLTEDGITVTLKESDNSLQLTGLDENQIPEAGQIIWSQPTEELPYGFMGKVKETTSSNGTVTITTETVALDEVFDKLLINEKVALIPTDNQSRSSVLDENPNFNIALNIGDDTKCYSANGGIDVATHLIVYIDLDKNRKASQISMTIEADATFHADMSVKASYNDNGDTGTYPLGKKTFNPVILAYCVVIAPEIQFNFHGTPSGEISFTSGLEYNTKGILGVEYLNGTWQYRGNGIELDQASPWDMKSSVSMNGSFFCGLGLECKAKFYNMEDMKISFEPQIGIDLSGEIKIDSSTENIQESLKDAHLKMNNVLKGSVKVDASVIADQLAVSFDVDPFKWDERELYLLPMFENLAAQTRIMTSNSRASTDPFEATITMTGSRELLSKSMKISTTVVNEDDNNDIQYANFVDYEVVGGGSSSQNFTTTFSNLNPNGGYRAYPKVNSPILGEELNYELELTEQNISFRSPARDLRDQLVKLYKDTGGENWTNNENWCSDKPIETWYGIYELDEGKYGIVLPDNNLTGTVSLSSPDIQDVVVADNQIENICLAGCSGLKFLEYSENPLVSLDLSECKLFDINDHHLNIESLRELRLRNCTQITELSQIHSALETLDLSGCENLEYFPSSSVDWSGLSYVNISKCKLIENLNSLYGAQLKYLNINECTSLSDISLVDFEILEEFYAKNCTNLKNSVIIDDGINREEVIALNFSNIKVLDIENCSSIGHIYVDPQSEKITNINVKGCSSLFYLSCYNGQLTSINLEGCDKLETLYCSGNQLSQLDLSKCPLLKDVQCGDNLLTEIDVTNNTELEILWCDNNELTSLDLTYNTQLKKLYCDYNQLQSLDFFSNPLMEMICCENNAINTIRLDKCGQLTYLACRNNQLTSLNISQNKNLEKLYCSNNKLSELDFTKLSNLSSFEGRNLNIKDVDVSNLTSLSYFSCTSDYLQSVNLGGCSNLKNLHLGGPVTDFNHDMCSALETISIFNTNLSSLDFDGYSALTSFTCQNNGQLESLNLSGCTSMITLSCANNPMLSDLTLMTYAPLEGISFLNTKVSMEIPAFFPLYDGGSRVFHYVRRYTNYQWITNADGTETLTYTDNGYGWWFPGEPDSGKHAR